MPPAPPTLAEPAGTLPTPFTARQIHDGWVEGLSIVVRRYRDGADTVERWTVVGADADGATTEFLSLDSDGQPAGEPALVHSSWEELRDHASFPADRATRERTARDTPLGRLEGWRYEVHDPASGAVTRFFFADDAPGAPVHMISTIDDRRVAEMTQLERRAP